MWEGERETGEQKGAGNAQSRHKFRAEWRRKSSKEDDVDSGNKGADFCEPGGPNKPCQSHSDQKKAVAEEINNRPKLLKKTNFCPGHRPEKREK